MTTLVGAVLTLGFLHPAPMTSEQALRLALNDEYHAYSTYGATMSKFGEIRPFVNIQRAEQFHINLVKEQMNRLEFKIPKNSFERTKSETLVQWQDRLGIPATVHDACLLGVKAEIANVDLYTELYKADIDSQIRAVFEKLQADSQERHLPAFQRCAGIGTN